MHRALAPLWLAGPSRFAGLTRRQAWFGLAALALLLFACLLALVTPEPPHARGTPATRAEDRADVTLYATIVDDVRHGGNYYPVTANALRVGDYPLKPFVAFRLPTLAMVEASLPPVATLGLLYLLVAATVVAWYRRLAPAFSRAPPRFVAMALLACGLAAMVKADLIYFHEIWAGLLISLSLALRRPDRWLPSVAFGLAAVLVRETAAPYLVLMAFFAFAEGNRREGLGWLISLAILGAALALHAHAVADVVHPSDPSSLGWAGMLGFGFFVSTMAISTGLAIAPLWLAAPLVGLAMFGWAAWRDDVALRMVMLLSGYSLILATVGRVDTFYWGFLVAPALLVGLAVAPDGLRDLIASARDTRRITVKRIVR